MNLHEKELRRAIRLEIRARKLVLKRLEKPLEKAQAAGEKKKAARAARWASASIYGSYEEAQEAYGCGMITQEEFWEITDILEEGQEHIDKVISPEEAAADILREVVARIRDEISGFEWDLLSEKEKQRIRTENEKIMERRRLREANRNG